MKKQVVVLGGGISGLSLGFYLKKKFGAFIDLILIEKNKRCGGWVQSEQREGYFFEKGPRTLRGDSYAALQLIEELGLWGELLEANNSTKVRYIYAQQQLHPMPQGFFEMMRSPFFKGIKRALMKGLLMPGTKRGDETIHSFAERRFSQKVANQLFAPLVLGIFAGNIKQLSLKSCFPSLYKMEQQWCPPIFQILQKKNIDPEKKRLKRRGLFSLKKGLSQLVDALEEQIEVLPNCQVTHLAFGKEKIEVHTDKGTYFADVLFSALPASKLSPLLNEKKEIQELLEGIPQGSLGVVHLGWQENVLGQKGFGYLIPPSEGEPIYGVVFDSEIFPEQNGNKGTRLTVMMEKPSVSIALKSLKKHLNITQKPDFYHESLAKNAIAQYQPGHCQIKQEIRRLAKKTNPHFHILGSSFDGVSLNDCILHSQRVVDDFTF